MTWAIISSSSGGHPTLKERGKLVRGISYSCDDYNVLSEMKELFPPRCLLSYQTVVYSCTLQMIPPLRVCS